MIHVVTSQNRHLYGPQLWAMHEQRREQCVEKNGWIDLVVLEGGEVDDYDDAQAIYLLGFDDAMRLEVGLRLHPTDEALHAGRQVPAPDRAGRTAQEGTGGVGSHATVHHRGLSRQEGSGSRRPGVRGLGRGHGAGPGQRGRALRRHDRHVAVSRDPELADRHPAGRPAPPYAFGVVAGSEIALSYALLDRVREAICVDGPVGYHVDELDLRAFGGLAAVQRQVIRAQILQFDPGSARDEALTAETLYRLNDTVLQAPPRSGTSAALLRPGATQRLALAAAQKQFCLEIASI